MEKNVSYFQIEMSEHYDPNQNLPYVFKVDALMSKYTLNLREQIARIIHKIEQSLKTLTNYLHCLLYMCSQAKCAWVLG